MKFFNAAPTVSETSKTSASESLSTAPFVEQILSFHKIDVDTVSLQRNPPASFPCTLDPVFLSLFDTALDKTSPPRKK